MDLSSLQTTVSRISARLNENLSETARDLGLQGIDPASLAGAGAAGRYLEDGSVVTRDGIRETKKLLETRREASMAEGLRRVLAMMLRGMPVVTFFPQVVQCLSSSGSSATTTSASSIQIRSLVSIYILRQASLEPDLALLAVNMYQKDLRDPNPVIRALAIRTLAGMELDSIVTLVLMSLKTLSRDGNWFVRRTVAESLESVYVLDPSHLSSLTPILETGLADVHPIVMGASLAAFESICPDRFDLLHPHYRRFCKSLVDADEWTQIVILRVLEKYARTQFAEPDKGKMHPDLTLLLQCSEPLLWNRSAAVVASTVGMSYRISPTSFNKRHAAALVRLLQSPPEIQSIVLAVIATIARDKPAAFADQFLDRFFVYQLSDNQATKALKLQILVLLANTDNIKTILDEFATCTRASDMAFKREIIVSMGECAAKVAKVQEACLKALMGLLDARAQATDEITGALLHEVSRILHSNKLARDVVETSLKLLFLKHRQGGFNAPGSRAEFYRMLAGIMHLLQNAIPNTLDVVRLGAAAFAQETESGKTALLDLSTRLIAICQKGGNTDLLNIATRLHTYLLTLGRYDQSWSVRTATRIQAGLTTTLGIAATEPEQDGQIEEEAFAKGEAVSLLPIQDQVDGKKAYVSQIQRALTSTRQNMAHISSTKASSGRSTHVSNYQRLAGWPSLPEWPSKSAQHDLRDSTQQATQAETSRSGTAESAYRGFGNTSKSGSAKAQKTAYGGQAKPKRRPQEQIILVPTETEPAPAGRVAQARKEGGLQAFLESSDDDDDQVEGDGQTESEEESTSSGEDEDEDEEEDDSEAETESESDDAEEDVRAPLQKSVQ